MDCYFHICFKDGVVWNFTKDEDVAKDWLDRELIECYALFTQSSQLAFKERKVDE